MELKQFLFEHQTTIFHLAEHLALLSLEVNVSNMGLYSGGLGSLSWQASGEQPFFNQCLKQLIEHPVSSMK